MVVCPHIILKVIDYLMCMKLTKFWKRYLRLKKNYAFSIIDFQHQPPPISPLKFHQNIEAGTVNFLRFRIFIKGVNKLGFHCFIIKT